MNVIIIQILIVIVRFTNFIFSFQFSAHGVPHPSLTGDLSFWGVFRVLLGRTFVFGLHTKNPKNLKLF